MSGLDEIAYARAIRTIEVAAPPGERLARDHFTATGNASDGTSIAAANALVASIGRCGDPDIVLAELGWSRADVQASVTDVTLRAARMPAWAAGYLEFLAAATSEQAVAHDGPPLARPDRLFRAVGRAAAGRIARDLDLECESGALDDLAAQLARRMHVCLTGVFDFELRVDQTLLGLRGATGTDAAAGESLDVTLDGWLRRAELMPVTSYTIGLTWQRWCEATRELLGRLKHDWPLLRTHVLSAEPAARLERVQCDAGDLHHGGRAVAIVRACGRAIVYKPRDGRASALFLALERAAAEGGAIATSHERSIVCRSEYSWETFVVARPCHDITDVESFYRALGGTLRLLELVEARDCWLDNLIAVGPQPVFIDLETILQGRLRGRGVGAMLRARDLLDESAAVVGVTAAPTLIGPGRQAEDVGAVSPYRRMRLPYRPELVGFRAAGALLFGVDRDGYTTLDPPPYAPMLDGRAVPFAAHVDEFVSGYRQAHTWIASAAPAVIAQLERDHDIARLPVRYIYCDTWSYSRALHASLSPEHLASGIAREIALWSLVPASAHNVPAASGARVRIAEVAATRDLDIPFFTSRPGGTAIYTAGGEAIADLFDEPALARLRRRAACDPLNADERVAIAMSSASCGRHRAPHRRGGRVGAPKRVASAGDALDAACQIGDVILRAAIRSGRSIAWHGLAYNPLHDVEVLGVLEPELLTGTLGIAVALADLFAATARADYGAAAAAVLEACTVHVGEPAALGAFWGAAALYYTRSRCANALRVSSPTPIALVEPIAAAASDPFDLIGGAAGIALACDATPAWWHAVMSVVRSRVPPLRPYPKTARRLRALPSGEAARRLVERRLGCAETDEHDPRDAEIALRCLRRGLPHSQLLRGDQLLDLFEIALDARAASVDVASDACAALAAELCERTSRRAWFPERLASPQHDLSIIWGVPAMLHALVRYASPSITSVRVLGH